MDILTTRGEESVCTSIIVAAELRFGAVKSGSKKLADRVDLILSALAILPLEAPADPHYGDLRHNLTRQGILIGPNDLLIAAHALSADLTVVTANAGEFSRVPGLKVENWLEKLPSTPRLYAHQEIKTGCAFQEFIALKNEHIQFFKSCAW